MPWAAIIPAVAASMLTDNEMINRTRINYGGMSMLISNNQGHQQPQIQQPTFPEAPQPEFDPLMSTLLDLLAKDRETNPTD
jgi:hypothetical protein